MRREKEEVCSGNVGKCMRLVELILKGAVAIARPVIRNEGGG